MGSPRLGRVPGSPAAKCHRGPTRGSPADAGTAAPAPPPPPPFAARPGRREVTRCSLALAGSAQGGRRRGRRWRRAGRSPRPRPPALQADPHLLQTGSSSAAARLAFYGPTPALPGLHSWAAAGFASGLARVPPRPPAAGVPCVPLGQPRTRCPQVGGGDTTAEAASSVCDPGAWCQRDLEFPVWLVLGPAEPG